MKLNKAIKKEEIIMSQISKLMGDIDAIYEKVKYPNDDEIRPATLDDIVEGAILWNPNWEGQQWCLVSEVENLSWAKGKMFNFGGSTYKVFASYVEYYIEIDHL